MGIKRKAVPPLLSPLSFPLLPLSRPPLLTAAALRARFLWSCCGCRSPRAVRGCRSASSRHSFTPQALTRSGVGVCWAGGGAARHRHLCCRHLRRPP
eukprot:1584540-Rhodomonas_salina.1